VTIQAEPTDVVARVLAPRVETEETAEAGAVAEGEAAEGEAALAEARAVLEHYEWLGLHTLRTSAEALYRESVLSGARVVQLARSCRCACHLDWGPPRADPSRPAIDAAATR